MRLHHTGYVVKDLDRAAAAFAKLGFRRAGAAAADRARRVRVLFLKKGAAAVELVAPYGAGSPAAGLLKRLRNAPYHLCFESRDFDRELAGLEAGGFMRVAAPLAAPALGGRRAVFLMSPAIGLVELAESRR